MIDSMASLSPPFPIRCLSLSHVTSSSSLFSTTTSIHLPHPFKSPLLPISLFLILEVWPLILFFTVPLFVSFYTPLSFSLLTDKTYNLNSYMRVKH